MDRESTMDGVGKLLRGTNLFLVLDSSLVAQLVKNLPAVQETWVRSLGWEDPLEKGMATHSSILAWRIPKKACAKVPGCNLLGDNSDRHETVKIVAGTYGKGQSEQHSPSHDSLLPTGLGPSVLVQLTQPFQISLLPNFSSLGFHRSSSRSMLNPTELTALSKLITLFLLSPLPPSPLITPIWLTDAHLFVTSSEKPSLVFSASLASGLP